MPLIRMTYTYPEITREKQLLDGRTVYERVPDHPKREARDTDANCWYEDVPDEGE